jgi:hypothetical protein
MATRRVVRCREAQAPASHLRMRWRPACEQSCRKHPLMRRACSRERATFPAGGARLKGAGRCEDRPMETNGDRAATLQELTDLVSSTLAKDHDVDRAVRAALDRDRSPIQVIKALRASTVLDSPRPSRSSTATCRETSGKPPNAYGMQRGRRRSRSTTRHVRRSLDHRRPRYQIARYCRKARADVWSARSIKSIGPFDANVVKGQSVDPRQRVASGRQGSPAIVRKGPNRQLWPRMQRRALRTPSGLPMSGHPRHPVPTRAR